MQVNDHWSNYQAISAVTDVLMDQKIQKDKEKIHHFFQKFKAF